MFDGKSHLYIFLLSERKILHMDVLTPERIQEKIESLEKDNIHCNRVMRSKDASLAEKGECRMRSLKNRQELIHLYSTMALLHSDSFMKGVG